MALFNSRVTERYASEKVSWWTRAVSFDYNKEFLNEHELELRRRSRFTGWCILAAIIGTLLLVPDGLNDPVDLGIVIGLFVTEGLMILLNRNGKVAVAAVLLVIVVLIAALAAPYFLTGALDLDELPDFDLMAIAVVLAASTLPPIATWIVLACNVILIVETYFLLPHAPNLILDLRTGYSSPAVGTALIIVRPIILSVFVAAMIFALGRGLRQTLGTQYAAMRYAEHMDNVATAMFQTAEQKTIAQHYDQMLNEALVMCFNRRKIVPGTKVELQFSGPAKSQFELAERHRIQLQAQTINLALKTVDSDSRQTQFKAEQFEMVVHQYSQGLADTIQDGDVRRLHPKRVGVTGFDAADILVQLVYAFGLKAEAEKIYSKVSGLPVTPEYVDKVTDAARNAFHTATWNRAPGAQGAAFQPRYPSAGHPSPLPRGARPTPPPGNTSSSLGPSHAFDQSDPGDLYQDYQNPPDQTQSALYNGPRRPGGFDRIQSNPGSYPSDWPDQQGPNPWDLPEPDQQLPQRTKPDLGNPPSFRRSDSPDGWPKLT